MHSYLVEWSAPNHRDSKSITVRAATKASAVNKAKERLGKKVKEKHLHHFYAIKKTTYRRG